LERSAVGWPRQTPVLSNMRDKSMVICLSYDQKSQIEKVREIAKTIALRNREVDETSEFPWDIFHTFKEKKVLDLPIPAEFGGGGAHSLVCCLVLEEIARYSPASAHMLAGHWLGYTPLELFCNPSQREKYFPRLRSEMAAFSLTEPSAGSDAGGVITEARGEGNHFILNGTKIYCTQGHVASVITVFAKTAPQMGVKGLSAFIVEKGFTGFSIGKVEDQMGMRGTPAAELIFQDCFVPEENLLGKGEEGFNIAMQTLDRTRPKDAAISVGISQGALDYTIDYVKKGVFMKEPLIKSQGVQFLLADMAIAIEAARLLVYEAAFFVDKGEVSTKHSAMAKCFATDIAMKVTDQALDILGAEGVSAEHPIEMFMRDAKLLQILEGTNQIQRVIISRSLLG
jgi:alkylation response protein AidB-like acyl-CoA dehydrogenase